jgi:hypothetical protein
MARKFLTPIDMSKLEVQNQRLHFLASAPGSPVEGMIYFDSVTHKPYTYNGSGWDDLTGGGVAYGTATELAVVDGAAEDAGASALVARADHKHLLSLGNVTAQTSFGAASANGTADTAARSDHVHGTPSVTYAGTADLADVDGAAEAAGSATTFARGDHKHLLSLGNVTAQTSFGGSSGNGSSNSAARTDHTHGTPTHDDAAHSTVELNDLAAPDGDVSFGSQKITNLGTPAAATDGATKGYVDSVASGLDAKQSVRVATTAAGTLATSFANGQSVDGITLATNDRILIKDQAAPAENGIYIVNAAGAPTRATDADAWAELVSAFTWVEVGSANADTGWVSNVDAGGTLGTNAVTFVQFTGAAQITAGGGLTKNGNTLDVGGGTGISVNSDDIAVTRTGVNGAHVPLLYAANVGDNSSTSITVTHNLGTKDVIVQLWDNTTPFAQMECDVEHATTSTVTLKFATAPTTGQYRVVVFG